MGGEPQRDEKIQGMIVVDTSVWIDFFVGKNTLYRHALHQFIEQEEELCITEIILTEILQGIRDDEVFEITKRYLLNFPCISPKGIETYLDAAEIYRKCRKKGKTIRKTIDCIIAAIVRENRLTLFHNDSDFMTIAECTDIRILEI